MWISLSQTLLQQTTVVISGSQAPSCTVVAFSRTPSNVYTQGPVWNQTSNNTSVGVIQRIQLAETRTAEVQRIYIPAVPAAESLEAASSCMGQH